MKMKKCIAGIMAMLTAFSVFMFGGCDDGADTGADKGNNPPNVENNVQTDITITENESNGLTLCTAPILESDYAAYGVSEQAESAVTITASYTPEYVTYPELDWTVAFVDSTSESSVNSEWAKGKTVTDYVTVTPTADGSLTAVVECLQAFGESIVATITSRKKSDISATVVFQYEKRVMGFTAGTIFGLLYDAGPCLPMEFIYKTTGPSTGDELSIVVDSLSKVDLCKWIFDDKTYALNASFEQAEGLSTVEFGEGTIARAYGFNSYLYISEDLYNGLVLAGFTFEGDYTEAELTRASGFRPGLLGIDHMESSDASRALMKCANNLSGSENNVPTEDEWSWYYKYCEVVNNLAANGTVMGYWVWEMSDGGSFSLNREAYYFGTAIYYPEGYPLVEAESVSVSSGESYTF